MMPKHSDRLARALRARRCAAKAALPPADACDDPYASLIELWLLRIVVSQGKYRKLLDSLHSGEVLGRLGFEDPGPDEKARDRTYNQLKRKLRKAEANQPVLTRGPLAGNIRWLREALGLDDVECAVLAFVALLCSDSVIDNAADLFGNVDAGRAIDILAGLLDLPRLRVRDALRPDGTLISAGILKFDTSGQYNLRPKLDFQSGFHDALMQEFSDPVAMLNRFFRPAPAARLKASDYAHVAQPYGLIRAYLKAAAAERRAGVNILIHGRPGTGKTELVRTLCQETGLRLYEVATQNDRQEPLDREDRYAAYRFAQCMLRGGERIAILFDEVEDVFVPKSGIGEKIYKAWLNRLLEENPVPAFWISNSLEDVDPAYLRRFDYILELAAPPKEARKRILREHLGMLAVRDEWLERVAANSDLLPGYAARAARVAACVARGEPEGVERAAEQVLDAHLQAISRAPLRQSATQPLSYDLAAVNADLGLEEVIAGISARGFGRLCLYGPPGTGKTAFAHHLAQRLGRPMHAVAASSIMSKYIGETEANLARTFRRATTEGAVLLLDEADSFLQDRNGAQRSWEVTQVNELLVQLEQFEGVLVACTNFMSLVDGAAMRRFDFKIKFDYLRLEQRVTLFRVALRDAGHVDEIAGQAVWAARLARLDLLTPGDFAAALRRLKLTGAASPESLIEALEAECRLKPEGRMRPMGFVQ